MENVTFCAEKTTPLDILLPQKTNNRRITKDLETFIISFTEDIRRIRIICIRGKKSVLCHDSKKSVVSHRISDETRDANIDRYYTIVCPSISLKA